MITFVITMTIDEFISRVEQQMGFSPTADQHRAVTEIARFLAFRHDHAVMVMRGSAGTGKTTLTAALVRTLASLRQKMVLLAPTGRAAKVLSHYSGMAAFTIHRKIYRERSVAAGGGVFNLNDNLHADTLFVVDEASMIANEGLGESVFGSGCLLDDLITYVYGGRNCRLMLIGDTAQLPPVGEEESPALAAEVLQGYGLSVFQADLDEVVRQAGESGILYNATMIRTMITHDAMTQLPRIRLQGFADVSVVPGNELIEALVSAYADCGTDGTIVVTRSNKRANIYNNGIRARIFDREDELTRGDLVMAVKNNYHWTELAHRSEADEPPYAGLFSFIANGDAAEVVRLRNVHEMYGFRFADATLRFADYDDEEIDCRVLLSTLSSESPSLTAEEQERLFDAVMEDYADVPSKKERLKCVREDAYYNALQIKYAYAVTCHKAQGGQWQNVFIDMGGIMPDALSSLDFLRWLYTAITRARRQVYLINCPLETDFR